MLTQVAASLATASRVLTLRHPNAQLARADEALKDVRPLLGGALSLTADAQDKSVCVPCGAAHLLMLGRLCGGGGLPPAERGGVAP